MREFIENEYLLPSLAIGVPESVFWKKTPRTLQVYFKAQNKKDERAVQMMWKMGDYIRTVLQTTPVILGFANGKLPDYPDCPNFEVENNPKELNEQWVQNERLRAYAFFKSLGKHK